MAFTDGKTVEELIDNNSKDELVEEANRREVSSDGNKPDIAKSILEARREAASEDAEDEDGVAPESDNPELVQSADTVESDATSGAAPSGTITTDTVAAGHEDDASHADETVVDDALATGPATATADNDSDVTLVKMERSNVSYSVARGYTFTAKHPFLPLPSSLANHVVDNLEGFRLASESEVRSFYS